MESFHHLLLKLHFCFPLEKVKEKIKKRMKYLVIQFHADPNQKETNFLNIFVVNIFQEIMVKMKPLVFLISYITNKLNILMEKVKPRRKRIKQVLQFFM